MDYTRDKYLSDDPANDDIEIDVLVPDSYQSPLFKAHNSKSDIKKHPERRSTYYDAMNGRVMPKIDDWCYWSDEELVYLVTHYQYFSTSQIARILGRTVFALKGKIKEIKNNPKKGIELINRILSKS